mmetsp:Transcript_4453/g.4875  ORF Transcript_4453/g.4875 Transcript_4453/m.4875 type:complete len:145 (-) Transcript_4453:47-481(-)
MPLRKDKKILFYATGASGVYSLSYLGVYDAVVIGKTIDTTAEEITCITHKSPAIPSTVDRPGCIIMENYKICSEGTQPSANGISIWVIVIILTGVMGIALGIALAMIIYAIARKMRKKEDGNSYELASQDWNSSEPDTELTDQS